MNPIVKSILCVTFDTVTLNRSNVMEFPNRNAAIRSFTKFKEEKNIPKDEMILVEIAEIDFFGNVQTVMPRSLSLDGNIQISWDDFYVGSQKNSDSPATIQ